MKMNQIAAVLGGGALEATAPRTPTTPQGQAKSKS